MPKPAPAPPPQAADPTHAKTLLPAYWQDKGLKIKSHTAAPADLKRTQRVRALEAGAKRVDNIHTSAAKAICPSATKNWWEGITGLARTASKSYTGGGSGASNASMREPENATAATIAQSNAMDELFERNDTFATEDCVVHRGESVPAAQIYGAERDRCRFCTLY